MRLSAPPLAFLQRFWAPWPGWVGVVGLFCLVLGAPGAVWGAPAPGDGAKSKAGAKPKLVLTGTLLDPKAKLIRGLGLGEGPPQNETERRRVLRHLDALGYKAEIEAQGERVTITVEPFRVIRKIYIKGNWPIFEDEILRRIRFRPGQRLPQGKDLELAIERQEERVTRFLSREGYFDGHLRIWVKKTDLPHQVNLEVRILKGKRYKIGEVTVEPVGGAIRTVDENTPPPGHKARPGRKRRPPPKPSLALPDAEIEKLFQQKFLFYRTAFSTETFKEDVEELEKRFHNKHFPGVRIRESYEVDRQAPADQAVKIRLKIQQRKQILVRYHGNNHLDDDELNEVLTIYDEGTYDDWELAQSARKIHRLYQSKGYLQARVHFSREVGRRRDVVTFQITEGVRYRVEQVTFAGNRAFDDDALREVVRTKPFPLLGWVGLSEGGYVTDLQLEQDVERLENFYVERGFPEVQVRGDLAPHPLLLGRPGALAAALADKSVLRGKLYVRFTVEEGQRQTVEDVLLKVAGAGESGADQRDRGAGGPEQGLAVHPALLKRQLQLKRGSAFTAKAVPLDKARLVRIYSERGYPYAAVTALEEISADGTQVRVQFSIDQGPKVRFGPVFIRGNFKTRDRVILDDITFKPGDPFDIRQIELAERLLRKREIFNAVRVQPLGMSARRTELPVVVQVEERYDDYGALEFSVGGSTDNKIFGAAAYRNRNVLGFGTELSLQAEYGWELWNGSLHYRDPRLLGSTFVLDLKGFARNQDTERLGEIFTFGGTASLSREFFPGFTALVRYEIRRTTHREEIFRPAGVDESDRIDVFTRVAGVGPTVVLDRRNNKLNPTSGFRIAGSMLFAHRYLGGSDDFLKFNVNGQAFIPLPKGMLIALNVRYDHGLPLGARVTLPKVERYYAGGDTTIRGLEEDMAFTERIVMPASPLSGATVQHIRPQGGTIRLLTNVEFQFPIWQDSILFGLPLMGAIFSDNGVVTNSFRGFDPSEFRHGAGLALRVITPVGFTSIAYAFVLDPEVGDSRSGRLHFNFGYIF